MIASHAKPQAWWPGIDPLHQCARGLVACFPLWEGSGERCNNIGSGVGLTASLGGNGERPGDFGRHTANYLKPQWRQYIDFASTRKTGAGMQGGTGLDLNKPDGGVLTHGKLYLGEYLIGTQHTIGVVFTTSMHDGSTSSNNHMLWASTTDDYSNERIDIGYDQYRVSSGGDRGSASFNFSGDEQRGHGLKCLFHTVDGTASNVWWGDISELGQLSNIISHTYSASGEIGYLYMGSRNGQAGGSGPELYHLVCVWDRVLNPEEMRLFWGAPWSLISPPVQTPRFFAGISAGPSPVTGTAALVLPAVTAAASGIEVFTGTAAVSLAPATAAAAGALTIAGTAALTLQPLEVAASGVEVFTGTASLSLAPLTAAAAGVEVFIGTSALTLSPVTAVAAGHMNPSGTAALTLPAITASAAGSVLGVGTAQGGPPTTMLRDESTTITVVSDPGAIKAQDGAQVFVIRIGKDSS